jgi:hypothetical protein
MVEVTTPREVCEALEDCEHRLQKATTVASVFEGYDDSSLLAMLDELMDQGLGTEDMGPYIALNRELWRRCMLCVGLRFGEIKKEDGIIGRALALPVI